jgi:hypothetical protein
VALVLTLVQTKEMRIHTRKQNNTNHSTNSTKHSKYRYTYYQNTHTLQNPHIHTPTHYKTTTVPDTPKLNSRNKIRYAQYKVTLMYMVLLPQELHHNSLHFTSKYNHFTLILTEFLLFITHTK